MYMIGCDNKRSVISKLKKMLKDIDPCGEHGFYRDVQSLISDLNEPIEMAFLDVDMPGLDGITLASNITARYPLYNIVFLAEEADTYFMSAAFAIHASGYIIKPLTKEKIERDTALNSSSVNSSMQNQPSSAVLRLLSHLTL